MTLSDFPGRVRERRLALVDGEPDPHPDAGRRHGPWTLPGDGPAPDRPTVPASGETLDLDDGSSSLEVGGLGRRRPPRLVLRPVRAASRGTDSAACVPLGDRSRGDHTAARGRPGRSARTARIGTESRCPWLATGTGQLLRTYGLTESRHVRRSSRPARWGAAPPALLLGIHLPVGRDRPVADHVRVRQPGHRRQQLSSASNCRSHRPGPTCSTGSCAVRTDGALVVSGAVRWPRRLSTPPERSSTHRAAGGRRPVAHARPGIVRIVDESGTSCRASSRSPRDEPLGHGRRAVTEAPRRLTGRQGRVARRYRTAADHGEDGAEEQLADADALPGRYRTRSPTTPVGRRRRRARSRPTSRSRRGSREAGRDRGPTCRPPCQPRQSRMRQQDLLAVVAGATRIAPGTRPTSV